MTAEHTLTADRWLGSIGGPTNSEKETTTAPAKRTERETGIPTEFAHDADDDDRWYPL